jgi:16S rRNA (guanine(966)-N(2))-methyltransferase RsmD
MRIIGGKHKGRKLKSFDGSDIRPTSDRAKESLFNILSTSVIGAKFLDLCCGSGGIGLEAYSRGAEKVTFVDASKTSINLAKENALLVGVKEKFELKKDVDFLNSTLDKFDIIFYDPPYLNGNIEAVLNVVKTRNLLLGGVFIYERSSDAKPIEVDGFEITSSRKYGFATFDFYKEIL